MTYNNQKNYYRRAPYIVAVAALFLAASDSCIRNSITYQNYISQHTIEAVQQDSLQGLESKINNKSTLDQCNIRME